MVCFLQLRDSVNAADTGHKVRCRILLSSIELQHAKDTSKGSGWSAPVPSLSTLMRLIHFWASSSSRAALTAASAAMASSCRSHPRKQQFSRHHTRLRKLTGCTATWQEA